MARGGYHILDLHNTPFTKTNATKVSIPGSYESIEGAHYKPILMTGYQYDGIEYGDVFVMPQLGSDNSYTIVGVHNSKNVIIYDDDTVSIV